ncbi:hypothetical protein LTR17_023401 [Elasticomyces elasticus]|nr:hypothetical protein LTR17_023401 [Elasticomyces elasticus]
MSNFFSPDPPPHWHGPPNHGYPNQQDQPPPYTAGYAATSQPWPSPPRPQNSSWAPYPHQLNHQYPERQAYGQPYQADSTYPSQSAYRAPQSQQEGAGLFVPQQQQYDPAGNGDRGIGSSLAGAGAGAFLGHEMKGGIVADIGGAIMGAIAGNSLGKHEKEKHERRRGERRGKCGRDRGIDDNRSEDDSYGQYSDGQSGRRGGDEYNGYRGGDEYRGNGYRRDEYEETGDFRKEDFYDRGRW